MSPARLPTRSSPEIRRFVDVVEQGAKQVGTVRESFDQDGFVVLEGFLSNDHVIRLDQALETVVQRRRQWVADGVPHTGFTQVEGESTRAFYILDDHPDFLELLDWAPMMALVRELLNPMLHFHASDAIAERNLVRPTMGWHVDGHDNGFRNLGDPIPLLQLKVGYFLSDMSEGGQGNLWVVPRSHRGQFEPEPEHLTTPGTFPGAVELRVPAGSAVLFHNALWHSGGNWSKPDGVRRMLYFAYEHPWMVASMEHWSYPAAFYDTLAPERRALFHGFVFDPKERRWG